VDLGWAGSGCGANPGAAKNVLASIGEAFAYSKRADEFPVLESEGPGGPDAAQEPVACASGSPPVRKYTPSAPSSWTVAAARLRGSAIAGDVAVGEP
jgi:hypothetical protein